jgi:hypothetical protein
VYGNAVWQVIHLHVSGGGCLGQWGFSFLSCRGACASSPRHWCEQQAPFAALVNGFENGRAVVIVAEYSLLYSALDMSLQHGGHRPLHCTGDIMWCFSPFCIGDSSLLVGSH